MATLKIGRRELETSVPADLAEQLMDSTGHSPAEIRKLLEGYAPASIVASALLPFVKDAPHHHELAETITKAGVDGARAQVLGLYVNAAAKEAANGSKAKG